MLSAPLMAQTEINPIYDQARAEKVGADEYGMKRYVMAFLSRGPNRERPKAEADELQRLHMANIGRLAEEGNTIAH